MSTEKPGAMAHKIVRLEAENFKRLKAVEITPSGSVVEISGRNGAGKSSVLDAIEVALGGTRGAPSRPVRDGEESAKVVLTFEDIVVTRTFTSSGNTSLLVESTDGLKYPSPQAVLDKLVGSLSFDPLDFARLDPKRRLEMLRDIAGVDLSALDSERESVFADRTVLGRDGKRLDAQLAGMSLVEGVPDEAVSVSDIVAELDAAQAEHEARDAVARRIDSLSKDHVAAKVLAGAAEAAVAETARELAAGMAEAKQLGTTQAPDTDAIRARLSSAEDTNAGVRANARRAEVSADLETARRGWKAKSSRLKAIEAEKRKAVAAADLPVEGLSWDDDGVLLGGLPFDQASSAEKLRTSVAIAIALNPSLRVLLVRDGSLLDEDGLRLLSEMAAAAGAQVWLERVGDGRGVGVVIEDGSIK